MPAPASRRDAPSAPAVTAASASAFVPASPRWAHRAAWALLGLLTATTLAAIRVERDPPQLELMAGSRRATLLLSVSDGLLTTPLRLIDERVEGKLTGPQAAIALQASAERAKAAFRQLSIARGPATTAASAAATAQIHSLTLVLERLSNSLRTDDLDGARRIATAQLAPASVDLERALSTLAAAPAEAELRHRAWAEAHEETDRALLDASLAAGWAMALGLLWASSRLRRQTERLVAPRPVLEDATWRDCLRLGASDAALEGVANALVRGDVADLVGIARVLPSADQGPQLVLRQIAAGPAVVTPPWPGDPLLLPGRWHVNRTLQAGEAVMLGEHLSDLGTTFAWAGCPACARALLLPLWQGPVWAGCLAVFTQSADTLSPEAVARLRGVADAISAALGRGQAGVRSPSSAPHRAITDQDVAS